MRYQTATNARGFNEALNELCGTKGVEYASAWPMDVTNGEEYMERFHGDVGRAYAIEVLDDNAKEDCCLATVHSHADMTPQQRTALSYLSGTADDRSFAAALRACVKHGALPGTSLSLFQPVISVPRALPPLLRPPVKAHVAPNRVEQAAPLEQVAPPVLEQVAPPVLEQVAPPEAMTDLRETAVPMEGIVSSPAKVHLNLPAASGRTLSLHHKAKRRKNNK